MESVAVVLIRVVSQRVARRRPFLDFHHPDPHHAVLPLLFEPELERARKLLIRFLTLVVQPSSVWRGQPTVPNVKGGEKPDQRAEYDTAIAAVGGRWSEGVGMRPGALPAGNEGRA